jgi:hypothetical protein
MERACDELVGSLFYCFANRTRRRSSCRAEPGPSPEVEGVVTSLELVELVHRRGLERANEALIRWAGIALEFGVPRAAAASGGRRR